jgi:hypothetical protein
MFQTIKLFKLTIQSIIVFILLSILSINLLAEENDSKFRQVEATGRAILIEGNLEISRKRALEDALYIAALKGGANVNGFSAIGANTIINDQAIITAAYKVIDFKILKETQDKEFLSIQISAIVGGDLSSKNCKVRPINISLFQGHMSIGSDVPSNLARKMSSWFNDFYEIISNVPNVSALDFRNRSIDKVIKSNQNSSFDYNALANGIPNIQPGDYSLVPSLVLTKDYSKNNVFSNFTVKISFKIYKGSNFKLMPIKTFNFPIKYNVDSKFQFLKNASTLNINSTDMMLKDHLKMVTKTFFKNLYCRPLEGKLSLLNGELTVDLGHKQGLKEKQIGLVRGLKIKNSMLSNSSVVLHAESIGENSSKLLPLNDNVKLDSLDNLIVEFVE